MIRYHNLKVTNQCLNSCNFCQETKGVFLSFEELNSFLNQPELPESIRIFGGEPLLLDFLPDMVANLRRRGTRRVMIKTTAVPLSNFNLTFNLISKGAHHFEIEFFSSNLCTHQAMTNNINSFDLALQGISNLRRVTLESGQTPFLSFKVIVNSFNLEELSNNLSFLVQFRPDRFVLSLAPPLKEISLTLEKVKEAIKIANLNLIWLQTENIPLCLLDTDYFHYGELLSRSPVLSDLNKLKDCSNCQASILCQGVPLFYQDLEDFKLNPLLSSDKTRDFDFLRKEMELL